LFATSINPILTIDKKKRNDNEYHMNYKYWSYRKECETPSSI
jgi:hypothetical protein